MNVPSYIRTEWKQRGHAFFTFSDENCKFCKDEFYRLAKRFSLRRINYVSTKEVYPKDECKHLTNVECYLSTFSVWEYVLKNINKNGKATTGTQNGNNQGASGGRECLRDGAPTALRNEKTNSRYGKFETKGTKNYTNTTSDRSEDSTNPKNQLGTKLGKGSVEKLDDMECILPPTITTEIWDLWERYWRYWKEDSLNLSWVHRYPSLCSKEDVEWYEDYIKNDPMIIPYLRYCDDLFLKGDESLHLVSQMDEENKLKFMDSLFNELSSVMYWVYFRLYLNEFDFRVTKELQAFLDSHITSENDKGRHKLSSGNADQTNGDNVRKGKSKGGTFLDHGPDCKCIPKKQLCPQCGTVNISLENDYVDELSTSYNDKLIKSTICNMDISERFKSLDKETPEMEGKVEDKDKGKQFLRSEENATELQQQCKVFNVDSSQSLSVVDENLKSVNVDNAEESLETVNELMESNIGNEKEFELGESEEKIKVANVEYLSPVVKLDKGFNNLDAAEEQEISNIEKSEEKTTSNENDSIMSNNLAGESNGMNNKNKDSMREENPIMQKLDEVVTVSEYSNPHSEIKRNEIANLACEETITKEKLNEEGKSLTTEKLDNDLSPMEVDETATFKVGEMHEDSSVKETGVKEFGAVTQINTISEGSENSAKSGTLRNRKNNPTGESVMGVAWAINRARTLERERKYLQKTENQSIVDNENSKEESKLEDKVPASSSSCNKEIESAKIDTIEDKNFEGNEEIEDCSEGSEDYSEESEETEDDDDEIRAYDDGAVLSFISVIGDKALDYLMLFSIYMLEYSSVFMGYFADIFEYLWMEIDVWRSFDEFIDWIAGVDYLYVNAMKRFEKKCVGAIPHKFGPTLRHIPVFGKKDFHNSGLHMVKMEDQEVNNRKYEELIKVTEGYVQLPGPEFRYKSETLVRFMSEEDMIDELEGRPVDKNKFKASIKFENGVAVARLRFVAPEHDISDDDGIDCTECIGAILGIEELDDSDEEEGKKEEEDSSSEHDDVLYNSKITFDRDGTIIRTPIEYKPRDLSRHSKMNKILKKYCLLRLSKHEDDAAPDDIDERIVKYWHQRYRLFLRYDDGIVLDSESWFSVTPEMIAAHQAERCRCDTVIDAFCGAGGNAIQLAFTCNHVIAIDIDPAKIKMARKNAEVYGVEDRIEFIQGDFFALAPRLKADVVLLSPPWGGMEYLQRNFYDVYELANDHINGKDLMDAARKITPDIALYLPRNSNVLQVIEMAGQNGKVDIEFSHISNKRKSMTAYFAGLAVCNSE